MPDRYISVFGNVVVGEVTSPDPARPNARLAICEIVLAGSENSALVDVHFWGDRPEEAMSLAFLTGDMYCPADGEPVIFAETFTVHGRYADNKPRAVLPLSVLAIGLVRSVLENDTTLETEVYHRLNRARQNFNIILRRPEGNARFQRVPSPTVGALLLGRGVLSHFNQDGLAVVLIDSVLFFSFNPNSSRTTVQTPGKGKRKSELTSPPTPSPKKTKPDPPPFGPNKAVASGSNAK
ncbi:hypothetical protein CTheo_6480 [Ceratobasidium theobromae]|uniref:Uncharacterized protein n=1 Tax=Ceratobasidium theobromae TaxID=1582974 RepID=A0A5N5QEH7_9AGAM|nr:hypothetical protein CTheo_6480 [Ceratobasidium theobromae]